MFYVTPFDSGYVGIYFPPELRQMKIENMTLVEPFFIYALGKDDRDNEAFLCYDFMNKRIIDKSRPNLTHKDFKLYCNDRNFIYLIGFFSNRACEKYDIEADEWSMLPFLPQDSTFTDVFMSSNQYL